MYPTVTVHVGSCIVTLHVTQKRHPARTVKRVRLTIEEVTFSRLPQDIIESLPLCVYDLRIDRAQVLHIRALWLETSRHTQIRSQFHNTP
jgi:hypothetical protein